MHNLAVDRLRQASARQERLRAAEALNRAGRVMQVVLRCDLGQVALQRKRDGCTHMLLLMATC